MAKSNNSTTIDQSTIPRPLNCFLMYRLEKQKEIVAKCSGANHRDISKIIAKWWQEASEEEKRPFRERARIAKAEHRKLYPNYKYTPKKKDTPKRVYVRKNKKEQFTSRASENNKIMEMIYEDPTALENIDGVVEAKPKSACKANKVTKKNTKVSKERAGNTVVMENVYEDCSSDDYSEVDFKNEIYRSPCQYASSVYSTQTVPDFYFDSPQATSPSTDCYSDSDMQSPYAEPSPLDDFQLSYPMVPSSSSSSASPSSAATADFSLLDTPFINDLNAYSPMPLEAQLDYFQFDTSNINLDINTPNNNNIKYYPQEFCWNECPDYIFTQECQQSIMMQMSQPVQFIDPSILHNNM